MPNNTTLDSKASPAQVNLKGKKNPTGAWKLPTKSKPNTKHYRQAGKEPQLAFYLNPHFYPTMLQQFHFERTELKTSS
jgi:hypothetical protein